MSWDLFVMDLPADAVTVEDIPSDFVGRPLGTRSSIIETISELVPAADFSDPSWGLINTADFSIEVSLGQDEEVDSFAFHVRGGEAAVGLVAAILDRLSLRAFDPQSESGALFTPEAAADSLAAWRSYRDKVVGSPD